MKIQDLKIGMEINVKGFYKNSFPIIDINETHVTIVGKFSDKISIPQKVDIKISELLEGSFEYKNFTLKDFPQYNESILVSDDGDSWFIRSFDSFNENVVGGVYTTLQSNDKKMIFDNKGESVGHVIEWNMYKRFKLID